MAKLVQKYLFSCFLLLMIWMLERQSHVTIFKQAERNYPKYKNYLYISEDADPLISFVDANEPKSRPSQIEDIGIDEKLKEIVNDSINGRDETKKTNLTIVDRKTNIPIVQRHINDTIRKDVKTGGRNLQSSQILPKLQVPRNKSVTSYLATVNKNLRQQKIVKRVFLRGKQTRRTKPYSKYSYPLDMDFNTMYKEFSESGRISYPIKMNPHPFNYTHLSSRCTFDSDKNVSLLILVKSAARNFHLRRSIRATWGNISEENVKIVYLLAYDESLQPAVDRESQENGDIIQETFIDAYFNNTYKTIMAFNWAVEYCQQAKYQLFVDDDHFIILPNIMKYISRLSPAVTSSLYAGWRIKNANVVRAKTNKWEISEDVYPFDTWPSYLAGGAFILSRDVLRKFQFVFPFVKYVGIDDSYLGIVASKLEIYPQHVPSFHMPVSSFYKDLSHFAYFDFKSFGEFKKAMDFYQSRRNKQKSHHH